MMKIVGPTQVEVVVLQTVVTIVTVPESLQFDVTGLAFTGSNTASSKGF